jgi:RNA polymerase sigma-70 factor (ECF subfamily)
VKSEKSDFLTTQWSVILAAGSPESPDAPAALAALCQAYWFPLYSFVRRQGFDADRAEDLTQEFFARLVEKDFLKSVDRDKGKFRSFLLACLRHFLANERDRPRTQKRGSGRTPVSLDFMDAETRYRLEPSHSLTAEKLYERQWAVTLLAQVLNRLQEEWAAARRGPLFEALKVFLTGEQVEATYQQIGRPFRLSAGAVKVAVHRLRGRYRELLREEIGRLVSDPAEVDAEIRELFAALG